LKEARLDPENALALVVPPPSATEQQLSKEIRELPWTGEGLQALNIFEKTKEVELTNSHNWFKLGLALYDGKYYAESLEAFNAVENLIEKSSTGYFVSKVWQGHILDLLGKRSEAVDCYKEALKCKQQGIWVRHDQYGMVINREWVKQRIEKSFTRDTSQK
jgi:tetratricopeptide (TPR) repeat protein